MPTVSDALAAYLNTQRSTHNDPKLLDRWRPSLRTVVDVGTVKFHWFPDHGNFSDSIPFEIEDVVSIGCTGHDPVAGKTLHVGIDIDAETGHEKANKKLTPAELETVREILSAVDWLELRQSTGGIGLHAYSFFDGIETTPDEHKLLAEAVLAKLKIETGCELLSKVDKLGGNLWFVSQRATADNGGFKLLKSATRVLSENDLPSDWRDGPKPKATAQRLEVSGDVEGALAAMRRIQIPDNNDGTHRLHALCCRCRGFGLNLEQTIAAVRLIAVDRPPPVEWTDSKIEECWNAGLKKVPEGSEIDATSLWPAEGRTDAENAKRLVLKHGNQIRWVDPWGKWLIWNGRFWEEDNTCQIDAFAKDYARSLWADIGEIIATGKTDDTLRKALNSFGKSSNSASGIANMLRLARSEPRISIRPDQLDLGLFQLNAENGTIDLRTGELHPHNRADLITRMVPTVYDPHAKCPQFLKFLDGIFGGNKDLIGFVQRFSGHCLSGDVSEHVLIICSGEGSNGKSVYLNTMLSLLGDYATKAPEGLLTAKKFDSHPCEVAKLFGKRLVVACETDQGARLSEARVKMLTGGDRLTARGCGENFFDFDQTHKTVLATNHKPTVRGSDHGIWRRLKLIPFIKKFWDKDKGETGQPELQADKTLSDKLKAEYPGILAWLVAGCLAWKRDGLGVPAEVAAATAEYREAEDLMANFIADCCSTDADASESATTLLRAYKDYSGDASMNQKRFANLLTSREYVSRRITSGANKGRVEWVGLRCADSEG